MSTPLVLASALGTLCLLSLLLLFYDVDDLVGETDAFDLGECQFLQLFQRLHGW
jgi:hypothetical protein